MNTPLKSRGSSRCLKPFLRYKSIKNSIEDIHLSLVVERPARVSKNHDLMFRLPPGGGRASQKRPSSPANPGKKKKSKIVWLLNLHNTCLALEHMKEAAEVMARVIARDAKPDYLYNGGVLWLRAGAPDRAPPYLQRLTRPPSPRADWFAVPAHAWTQSNVPAKAAAMERAAP